MTQDLDALAKKYGGVQVDSMDSLAEKYGGNSAVNGVRQKATPFLEQARLSFGNKAEQASIVNPKGFDIGDIGRQAGKIPGFLGLSGGIAAGTAASAGNPLSPLAILGGGAGATIGEGVRTGIGKLLGVQQGTTPEEQVKSQSIEAITGAASAGVSGAITVGLNKLFPALKDAAIDISNKAVGPVKISAKAKAISQSVNTELSKKFPELGFKATESVGEGFLREGGVQTGRGIVETAKLTKKVIGDNMSKVIASSPVKAIQSSGIDKESISLLSQYSKSLNIAPETLANIVGGKPVPVNDWILLYRKLYGFIPKGAWDKVDPAMAWQKDALLKLAVQMSKETEKLIPAMSPLNDSYGLWSAIGNNVLNKLARNKDAQFMTLTQLMNIISKKTISSFPVKTGAAVGLNKLSQMQISNSAEALGAIGIMELFKSMEEEGKK